MIPYTSNKKGNQLDVVPSLDGTKVLIIVDPVTGIAYQTTVASLLALAGGGSGTPVDLSNYVDKSSNQNITGAKTFKAFTSFEAFARFLNGLAFFNATTGRLATLTQANDQAANIILTAPSRSGKLALLDDVQNGKDGADGQDGQNGQGVPTGGLTGQVLKKVSGSDFDTAWQDETASISNQNLQQVTDKGDTTTNKLTASNFRAASIPEYANNTAAIAGGLVDGELYRIKLADDLYITGVVHVAQPSLKFTINNTSGTAAPNFNFSGSVIFGMTVNWGDGLSDSYAGNNNYDSSHTYSTNESFDVKVSLVNPELITNVHLSSHHITTIDGIERLTSLQYLDLSNNQLNQSKVNSLLQYLDAATFNAGSKYLYLQQNAAPSGAGLTAKASLQSKGWSVTTD